MNFCQSTTAPVENFMSPSFPFATGHRQIIKPGPRSSFKSARGMLQECAQIVVKMKLMVVRGGYWSSHAFAHPIRRALNPLNPFYNSSKSSLYVLCLSFLSTETNCTKQWEINKIFCYWNYHKEAVFGKWLYLKKLSEWRYLKARVRVIFEELGVVY